LSAALSEQGDDRAAIEPLRTIQELFGEQTVDEATTLQLAALYRELENSEAERQQLERYAAASPDGFSALTRLMELQADAGDWIQVMRTAEKTLAINPLQPIGHERLVEASEQLDRPGEAARSLEVLAMLDPVDPAKLHLRTARAWLARGEPETAKRQLLMALEEAPHYRAAQDLLLQMVADGPPGGKAASAGKMPADAEQPAETEPDTDTARKAPDAASESSDAPTEQTATDEEGRDAE
jgi:tetratricopeptide (TPR) repeat protein